MAGEGSRIPPRWAGTAAAPSKLSRRRTSRPRARLPRPPAADPRRGRREGRPHRHRHAERLRPPDALRPQPRASRSSRRRRCTRASVFGELLWFLRGDTNVKWLQDRGITIWDEWADDERRPRPGLRLPVALVADPRRPARRPDRAGDRADPHATPTRGGTSSRRGTSPTSPQMALPPCHTLFQFYVADGRLSCQLYQRSADMFLGVPFNIASYALLTHMVAQVTGLEVGDFVHTLGDAHLYTNHLDQARLQLTREPRPLPTLRLDPSVTELDGFDLEDIAGRGLRPAPRHQGTHRRLSTSGGSSRSRPYADERGHRRPRPASRGTSRRTSRTSSARRWARRWSWAG